MDQNIIFYLLNAFGRHLASQPIASDLDVAVDIDDVDVGAVMNVFQAKLFQRRWCRSCRCCCRRHCRRRRCHCRRRCYPK